MMVENCIGKLSLPLGLGMNFLINGREKIVPMAIEEPSVIAAASSAAKLIKDKAKGFNTWSTDPVMIGQIQILDVDPEKGLSRLLTSKDELLGRLRLTKHMPTASAKA